MGLGLDNSDAYQSDDDNVRAIVDLSQEWLYGVLPSRHHPVDVILCTLIEFINVIYLKESLYYYLHNTDPAGLVLHREGGKDCCHICEELVELSP